MAVWQIQRYPLSKCQCKKAVTIGGYTACILSCSYKREAEIYYLTLYSLAMKSHHLLGKYFSKEICHLSARTILPHVKHLGLSQLCLGQTMPVLGRFWLPSPKFRFAVSCRVLPQPVRWCNTLTCQSRVYTSSVGKQNWLGSISMQGRTVDFKNTLIIMTSNVGSSVIEKGGGGLGFQLDVNEEDSSYNRIKTLVNEELKQYFRYFFYKLGFPTTLLASDLFWKQKNPTHLMLQPLTQLMGYQCVMRDFGKEAIYLSRRTWMLILDRHPDAQVGQLCIPPRNRCLG